MTGLPTSRGLCSQIRTVLRRGNSFALSSMIVGYSESREAYLLAKLVANALAG